jgi:hypothetical protein
MRLGFATVNRCNGALLQKNTPLQQACALNNLLFCYTHSYTIFANTR